MSFKKDKYLIVKKALSRELSDFNYKYLLLKRRVAETYISTKYISPFTTDFGYFNDPQVINTYSTYGDIATETLLVKLLHLTLQPNYAYARIYKNGDILERHTDRFSCEISTTLNLGGDLWPIFLHNGKKDFKINLKPGDMLIYRGVDLEHWREPFQGDNCAQVFLHYNNVKTENSKENLFDTRPHLGLSSDFKNKKS
jgi:hypothetical protein